MAASVNKVILVGNLGMDPEIKNFENGGTIANFSLATTETWRDKESNEKQSETSWHNIVIRRTALAKIAEQYLKKGMKVYVEGKLKTRTYEKNGEKRFFTEVVVEDFQMLGSPGHQGENHPNQHNQAETALADAGSRDVEGDDLPF